ncbi:hypothetical protein KVV02_004337 [Mortierella alpina]|uniref:RNA polymerase II elongation factor ELL N-terminal domain-containing protein n=1 Tax=Mortierella alpina TaxID=64518 RepID=A0A9P8A5U6_MORAP|nr:hypothetical protein KVV02_004337 [Mortierella alpina]
MPLNHNDPFVVNAAQPSRRQVIEFKLSEEVLEEILNGNESIRLDMNQAKLLIGGTSYDFTHAPGKFSDIEVYKLPVGSKQLDLVGNITSKCMIQRTHTKPKVVKQENMRTTQIIDPKDLKGTKATTQLPVRRAQSPSPSVAAAAVAATSGTVVPLDIRVVQLLATHPRGTEEKELRKLLRVGQEDLKPILDAVADLSGGRYVLKPETYRKVKIHDWRSYSAKQREIVVKNASAAFDKLGLPPDAPERDILSPAKIKRASPPLVAEGYHVVGNMDTTNSRWRSGGGGSESEGLDSGRMNSGNTHLKPPTQKKTSAKKSTTTSVASLSAKRKTTSSSKGSGTSTKAIREKAAAAILETVPNHSTRVATTPASSLKPTMGGTPNLTIGSPNPAGRRPSINGNGNGISSSSSASASASAKRGSDVKKPGSKETGGVGNGYKIPKVGSGTAVSRKTASPIFAVPPITSQAEYEEVSRRFTTKYEEMKTLRIKIDAKKELFDQLSAELELSMGTDRELELKRKVEDAFGEEVLDRRVLRRTGEPRSGISAERVATAQAEQSQHLSIRAMAERYRTLYSEVDTMKRALWEASTSQLERVSQPGNGAADVGNG